MGKCCSFGFTTIYSYYAFLLIRLSICVCASFPFGPEGQMWDIIVLVPNHYLYFYFSCVLQCLSKTSDAKRPIERTQKHNAKPDQTPQATVSEHW